MIGFPPSSVCIDLVRALWSKGFAPQLFVEFSAQLGLRRRFTYPPPALHVLINSFTLQPVRQKALNFFPMMAQQTLYVQHTGTLLPLVPRRRLPPALLHIVQAELQQT